MGGCWGAAGRPEDRVSVVAGLRQALPRSEILHAAGVPIERPEGRPSLQGSSIFPNSQGATNWWSPSYDAGSKTMYVPTMEGSDVYQKGPPITLPYGNYLGGFATFRPTWTAVRALDAATGHLRWEYRFPPRERSIVMGGLLSTDGDLVLGGDYSVFVALESGKGKELFSFWPSNGLQRIGMMIFRAEIWPGGCFAQR